MDGLDLFAAASAVLDVSAQSLDSLTAHGLSGAPARRYVAPGLPAFDCEQLTVYAALLSEAPTSPLSPAPQSGSRQTSGRVNVASFLVSVVRCDIPVSGDRGAPSVDGLEAAAEQIYGDGWSVWNGLWWSFRNGLLLGDDRCSIRSMTAGHPLDPQSGFGGWNVELKVQLPGFNPL